MLSGFADLLTSKQEKDPVIKHHLLYYSGQIPMWVLVEFLTLGDIYTLIMYLDREYRKEWVRSTFNNVNDKWIVEWTKTIQLLRNTCAHNARLYGSRPPYNPFIPDYDVQKLPERYNQETKGNDNVDKLRHTIFAGILTMRQFYLSLSFFDKEKWNLFLLDLKLIINEFDADLYRIGFPENWETVLKI